MSETEFQTMLEARMAELERLGAWVNGAVLCRDILRAWRLVREARDERLLSLEQAAALSGYSVDHLGRLVRQGKIPNAGTKYRPRLRAGDLPRRPQQQSIARPAATAYDPVADARSLASRRKGAA